MKKYITPANITSDEIKLLREITGMTQKEFAEFVGVSKRTVERWEYSDDEITGPITLIADMLIKNHDLPQKIQVPERKYKLRLWYMYHSFVCSIIDVDEMERKVEVHNYISNPLYRAMGVNTEPTFEEYEDFIRSRCFPETRDKLKLELKKLDIPFYDPIMIIEKTNGRMADDDFWIRIER